MSRETTPRKENRSIDYLDRRTCYELLKVDLDSGQNEATQQLNKFIAAGKPGSIVALMAPLGAGVTTFLRQFQNDLVAHGQLRKEDFTTVLPGASEPLNSLKPYKVLFVDSVESLYSHREDLMTDLEKIHAYRRVTKTPLVIAGDQTLKNPHIISEKIPLVEFKPMTPRLFLQILQTKLETVVGKTEAGTINLRRVFDLDFLNCIFPNTDPAVSTLGEGIHILRNIVSELPPSLLVNSGSWLDTPIHFSGEAYRKSEIARQSNSKEHRLHDWQNRRFQGQSLNLVNALHSYIQKNHNGNTTLSALSIEDLIAMIGSKLSSEEFSEVVLRPLLRTGVLKGVGIPYLNDPTDNNPAPYTPTPKTFLQASFGPAPAEMKPKKVGGIDEIKELPPRLTPKQQYDRLITLFQKGYMNLEEFSTRYAQLFPD